MTPKVAFTCLVLADAVNRRYRARNVVISADGQGADGTVVGRHSRFPRAMIAACLALILCGALPVYRRVAAEICPLIAGDDG